MKGETVIVHLAKFRFGIVLKVALLLTLPLSVAPRSFAAPPNMDSLPSNTSLKMEAKILLPLLPLPTPIQYDSSLLDEVGHLAVSVPEAQVAAWKRELTEICGEDTQKIPATETKSDRAGQLHLWLGEWEMAFNEAPDVALSHFLQVRRFVSAKRPLHGLSLYDTAVTDFRKGAYTKAAEEFNHLVKAPTTNGLGGYDRAECSLFLRHARACAGYHARRSALGIPEPPALDPFCGVAGLAICLKALHEPFDKETLLAHCRVTGFGSNLGDLTAACKTLGGVSARLVIADDEGLKALPLPAVAYVEHDHFVTVTQANRKGVTYVCSDCGPWPGGPVQLTWNQWHTLEASLYLTVVKTGRADDILLTQGLREPTGATPAKPINDAHKEISKALGVQVAVRGTRLVGLPAAHPGGGDEMALRVATLLAHVTLNQVPPASSVGCGSPRYSLHCPHELISCPFDSSGGPSCHGPSAGDPVNLATLEEEYSPEPDITVYNPKGPSVVWQRIYNSLRSDREIVSGGGLAMDSTTEFGRGWSNAYNSYVVPGGAVTGGYNYALILPNKSRIVFMVPTGTTYGNPVGSPGAPCVLRGSQYYIGSTPMTSFTIQWANGSVDTYKPLTTASATCYLTQSANKFGNSLKFSYTTSAPYLLTSIADDNNNALLTINRDTPITQGIVSVVDRYGRKVFYHRDPNPAVTNGPVGASGVAGQLLSVSIIQPATDTVAAVRITYGYVLLTGNGEGQTFPYLNGISTVSPTGSGSSAMAINYDPTTLAVSTLIDANGNQRVYTSPSSSPDDSTTVTVKNSAGTVVSQYTVGYNAFMAMSQSLDAAARVIVTNTFSSSAPDPYRPSAVTVGDANGHSYVYNYTWDRYGNILTADDPNGVYSRITYAYTPGALPNGDVGHAGTYNSVYPCGAVTDISRGAQKIQSFNLASLLYPTTDAVTPTAAASNPNAFNDYLNRSSFVLDTLGNLTSADVPGAGVNPVPRRVTTLRYDGDPAGNYSQTPAVGQPLVVTDALNHAMHYRYDIRGNLASVWDAYNNKTDYSYNLADQVTDVTSPATGQSGGLRGYKHYSYLYTGGPLQTTDLYDESGARIRRITYGYGLEGEPLSVTGNTPQPYRVTYDGDYRVMTVRDARADWTNPNGNALTFTTYTYDLNGNVTQVKSPQNNITQFPSYDALGRVLTRIDGNGRTTTYQYNDPLGNLTKITYPTNFSPYPNVPFALLSSDLNMFVGRIAINLSWDIFGRLATVNDLYADHTYRYNNADFLKEDETRSRVADVTISYGYNEDGSRNSMSAPVAKNGASYDYGAFTYFYDAAGRPGYQINPYNVRTNFSYYDNDMPAEQATFPNSSVAVIDTTYQHNPRYETAKIFNRRGTDSANMSTFGGDNGGLIAHDGASNVTYVNVTSGFPTSGLSGATAYQYNASNRLLSENSGRYSHGGNQPGYSNNYSYDASGNLTQYQNIFGIYNRSGQTYNNQNQRTGDPYATWDANGAQTAITGLVGWATYDMENQAAVMNLANSRQLQAGYGADGLRAWKWDSDTNVTRFYVYDGATPLVEMDGSGNVIAINTLGPNGLISRQTSSGGTLYAFDERGNCVQRLDAAGNVMSMHLTDAYGATATLQQFGHPETGTVTDPDPFDGFGAQWGYVTDHSTGMSLCSHRYYDPSQGRWITQDPIGFNGGLNLYAYCNGNPVNSIDPLGLEGEFDSVDTSILLISTAVGAGGGFIGGGGGAALASGGVAAPIGAYYGAAAGGALGAYIGGTIIAARHGRLAGCPSMSNSSSSGGNNQNNKPTQVHHYATNKSQKYTPRLERIAKKYGLNLDDSWNKEPLPHQGRHPYAYHEWVEEQMAQSDRIAKGDAQKFLQEFEQRVKVPVRMDPTRLYKGFYKP